MVSILVVGSGYTGTAITHYFRSKHQKVWGLVRTEKRKGELESMGAVPILADLTKPASLEHLPPARFIVLSMAPDERSEEAYRRIYGEGVRNFLASRQGKPKPLLIVYLSSTGVYRDRQGEWLDEETPPDPDTERGKILLEAEEEVLNSGCPAVVFRLSGIYGPGRNFIPRLKEAKRPGETRDRYVNMIHVEDIVSATAVLFEKAEAGKVYLGVDDLPVKRSELSAWLSEKLGIPKKEARIVLQDPVLGNRYRNTRLKGLGVRLKYPTFREGYAGILQRGQAPCLPASGR